MLWLGIYRLAPFLTSTLSAPPSLHHNLSCLLSRRQIQSQCLNVFYSAFFMFPKAELQNHYYIYLLCLLSLFSISNSIKKIQMQDCSKKQQCEFPKCFLHFVSTNENHINLKPLKYHNQRPSKCKTR